MAAYTWVLETRKSTASPWRVEKMDTEESGLTDRNFLNGKALELSEEYPDIHTSETLQLTVHTWA